MNRCYPHGPSIGASVQKATAQSIARTIEGMQAENYLPAKVNLIVVPGISAAIRREKDGATVAIDPARLSCLNPVQQKAVLLHEAGHWQHPPQRPELYGVASYALLAATGGVIVMRISQDYAKARVKRPRNKYEIKRVERKKPIKRIDRALKTISGPWPMRLPWGKAAFTAWTALGLYLSGMQRQNEVTADYYAFKAMGDGRPLAGALVALDHAQSDLTSALPVTKTDGFWRSVGQDFAYYGPMGMLATHPATKRRVHYAMGYKHP